MIGSLRRENKVVKRRRGRREEKRRRAHKQNAMTAGEGL